jgi:hypothetical protein
MGVEQLLVGVPEAAGDRDIQKALRLALGEPSLRLVLWREEHRGYVDVEAAHSPFRAPTRLAR